ncbi:GTPase HflX [Candidatus Dependentiae bacterium]
MGHNKKMFVTAEEQPKTLVLGIFLPHKTSWHIDDYFDEFESLVWTAGMGGSDSFFIKLRNVDRTHFLTKGKLKELLDFCQDKNFERIVCSVMITPLQQRNLEDVLGCRVMDRGALILEIFRKAAVTAEGKIQVEMAEIATLKTRMAGIGRELSQQEGRIGARGPGESKKEYDVRYFQRLVEQAQKRLKDLKKSRDVQRKRRLESGIPLVCLVGYTNAGKSSLLNLLTKSEVLVEDKLFATLDTTTRELFLNKDKKVLISDTVGFISQIPHHLIEAFRATLDELKYAHILLHVVDISNAAWEDQIEVVQDTLEELGIEKPIVHVFNKIDKLSKDELADLEGYCYKYSPSIFSHAKSKDGVKKLRQFLVSSDILWRKKDNNKR